MQISHYSDSTGQVLIWISPKAHILYYINFFSSEDGDHAATSLQPKLYLCIHWFSCLAT